jgi:hypothetical protein
VWPMEKIKGKHTLSRDKETKRGVSTANADKGGQKHAPTRDKETKTGVSTANTREDESAHQLETRRQRGL